MNLAEITAAVANLARPNGAFYGFTTVTSPKLTKKSRATGEPTNFTVQIVSTFSAMLGVSYENAVNNAKERAGEALRKSILTDPLGKRINTKDNTPTVVHIEMVHGDKVEVAIASKGGGSENKTHMRMLNPSDSVVDYVLSEIPHMGAGWCPPGIIGIGVGGTPEKSAILAKEALNDPIDIQELIA